MPCGTLGWNRGFFDRRNLPMAYGLWHERGKAILFFPVVHAIRHSL